MVEEIQFIVGICTPNENVVKAFDVCIKGQDVYVNYSDCSTPEAHSSYHASGQYHTKVGKCYVQWDGGPKGKMEPMKLFRTPPALVCGRSVCWTIGWQICKLDMILPVMDGKADMVIDSRSFDPALILGFEMGVIGYRAKQQKSILGYPIIASQRFGNSIRAEINAFVLTEEQENMAFNV